MMMMTTSNDQQQQQVTAERETAEQQLAASPSNEYSHNNNNYNDCFPALPVQGGGVGGQGGAPASGQAGWNNTVRVGSRETTIIVKVPAEERPRNLTKSDQNGSSFGEKESIRMCKQISKDTNTLLEMNVSRDQSATFLITGKHQNIAEAKRLILQSFQAQAQDSIEVPKQYHRLILGKQATRLKELEKESGATIKVPSAADASQLIQVTGPKEAIRRAIQLIKQISDEQSRKAMERIIVPRTYWPFFCGHQNSRLTELMADTKTKISLAPPSTGIDEIAITGDKEGVQAAKDHIMAVYNEMKEKSTTVSVEVAKSQHRYVIGSKGSGLAEIHEKTGVLVEMPPLDSDNQSTTIVLRGPQEKLGPALTMVYEKANSVVEQYLDVPYWIHRHLIGKKGADILKMKEDCPKVYVDFGEKNKDRQEKDNRIRIEGPLEEVRLMKEKLQSKADALQAEMSEKEMEVPTAYFKYIIGKNGANINRIKELTDANISINRSGQNPNSILIEGTKVAVAEAERELKEIISKLDDEREEEMVIDSRLHSVIIGQKGEQIREIREKFNNQVNVTFPSPNEKSDIVRVRGPKAEVDKCCRYLRSLVDARYTLDVPVFKQYHKLVIGKGGANIKKIKEDTNTKIVLPAEDSKSDVIVISGKKENVEQARDMVLKIQEEQANIVTESVLVPMCSVQGRSRLVLSIGEECAVMVKLPAQNSGDQVVVRGPKDDVEKAVQLLKQLANDLRQSSHTQTMKVKSQHHRVIIGKQGATIKRLRESTGCHIILPSEQDADQELITLIGKKENVEKAKLELQAIVKDIDNVIEDSVDIDPRHHKAFMQGGRSEGGAKPATLVNRIQEQAGGSVRISFPPRGAQSRVTIKGPPDQVRAAKEALLEAVDDFDNQVTIECVIPWRYHKQVMGVRGVKVGDITATYNVHIKFPDNRERYANARDQHNDNLEQSQNGGGEEQGGDQLVNGSAAEAEEVDPDAVRPEDIVLITGRAEKCELAKQALLDSVPVTEQMEVPFDYHRAIIGAKGQTIRELSQRFDVQISVPPSHQRADTIQVSGSPANVALAKEAIQDKMLEVDADNEDRKKKSFEVKLTVSQEYFPKIIGKKGAVVNKIREDHQVQIILPARGGGESGGDQDTITIVGYQERAEAARDEIQRIVDQLDSMIREEVSVDARIHPRLIGTRGRSIRQLMSQFQVEVKFAKASDPDPNIVVIAGQQDNVDNARERLLELAEDYMQDIDEYEFEQSFRPSHTTEGTNPFDSLNFNSNQAADTSNTTTAGTTNSPPPGGQGHHNTSNHHEGGGGGGFVVKGAPWEQKAPDTASTADFPSFGGAAPSHGGSQVSWGPRR
ncbi:vigilin [Nilaparvata lugens]|uniref:vigilin n=1 Tax=Nilaparvata lugens TaxID=108931 RepID=UPI00193E25DF|nr:vigilin [Nilaparvata lugens]XP_039296375.1 vigilin [Nilaparvata lugens]